MFKNKKIFRLRILPLTVEFCWGWKNGEGVLSVNLVDFNMWQEFKVIYLFRITAWVISFSIDLDLDFSA